MLWCSVVQPARQHIQLTGEGVVDPVQSRLYCKPSMAKNVLPVSGATSSSQPACYIRRMAESGHDSTAELCDARAATVFGAARSLPLTILHQGRRLQFHPDGRLEDLEPEDWQTTAEDIPLSATFETPTPQPVTLAPGDAIPEAFRELAETIAALANVTFDTTETAMASATMDSAECTVSAAADDAVGCDDQSDEDPSDAGPEATESDIAEPSDGPLAAAAAGTTEYGLRIMEATCINANAMLAFASALLRAKSLSEMVVVTTAHARNQIETVADQTKQLAAAAHKMASKKSGSFEVG
jgi:hypothetical protein